MRPHHVRAAQAISVLLIEADLNARARHEQALCAAGYVVLALSACPDLTDLRDTAVLLTDVPSFYWLQELQIRQLPPTIVLTGDEKAGVTACLCGADAWVPVDSEDDYLLDALQGLLRPDLAPEQRGDGR
jgi:DNA-binding response OmpR family regulator